MNDGNLDSFLRLIGAMFRSEIKFDAEQNSAELEVKLEFSTAGDQGEAGEAEQEKVDEKEIEGEDKEEFENKFNF